MKKKRANTEGLRKALLNAKEMLRPPPSMTPVEWAEKNIKIPIGNAVAGLVRFDNAPYQREVINQSINPECYRISNMWSAQTGKTQTALCIQAYHIVMRPVPQMMMQPSQGDLKTWLETKFNPMVEANKTLQNTIAKPRARKGVNNTLMKSYAGGFLMFAWAGSPKTMRGRSAPVIVADEVDGYDLLPEGHPVGLLWQRATTFGDSRKLIEISTPTIKHISYIEAAFLAGDQRRFYVVCPACDHMQTLKWDNVDWQGKDDLNAEQFPESALYHCESCGDGWNDGKRKAIIRDAEKKGAGWKASKPFKGHASYHLNELYSIFVSLRNVVQSYLDKLATNDLQTFYNVSLAETWEEIGEQNKPNDLYDRREVFKAEVPHGGNVLTAGVDMQGDRLELEVVAWGEGESSWSVDYKIFYGDPLTSEPWDELDEFLRDAEYQTESGSILRISGTALDTGGTGGNTQAAYDWLAGKLTRKIFGIKGQGGWGRPIVAAPTKRKSGRKKRKIDLFIVGVDEAKKVIMRRLGIKKPSVGGFCHFPMERDLEYFEQITAEKLITKKDDRGFMVQEWHKTRARNEAFDCRVYAYAALKIVNPSLKPKKNMKITRSTTQDHDLTPPEMEEVEKPIPKPKEENPPPVEKTPKRRNNPRISRTKKNWVKNWH